MRVSRVLSPIILAAAVLSSQSAFGEFSAKPVGPAFTDPSYQVEKQIQLMDEQNDRLGASLQALPATAVIGPKLIQEFDVDGNALQTAALKVEESIIESLQKLDGQYKNNIPTQKLSKALLASLPKARGDENFKCLADALYFEARGESLQGQRAVAEVIMNRVNSKRYPNSICGVVYQGTGRKYACQFTFTCDGHPEVVREKTAYARGEKIARLMIDGLYNQPITNGAIYYHTTAVRPSWASKKTPTTRLGVHIFYR